MKKVKTQKLLKRESSGHKNGQNSRKNDSESDFGF